MEKKKQHLVITALQVNAKRQWKNPRQRIREIMREAQKRGVDVVTLNEISKAQVEAIQNMNGWSISYQINDHLKGGNWAGNAVAWRDETFELENEWPQKVEIDYRKGKKFSPIKGRWSKKIISLACVQLRHKSAPEIPGFVQSFHYPTKFNSTEKSRDAAADKSASFAAGRVKKKFWVILGGDGNNNFPQAPGLRMLERQGPDGLLSNGVKLGGKIPQFKKRRLTDHNGVLAAIRFEI